MYDVGERSKMYACGAMGHDTSWKIVVVLYYLLIKRLGGRDVWTDWLQQNRTSFFKI